MAINIFEGARRIAKIFAAVWVMGWVVAAFFVSPSVDVRYMITFPGKPPVRMVEECPSNSATEYMYKKTTSGTEARIEVCFLALTAEDGTSIIPIVSKEELNQIAKKADAKGDRNAVDTILVILEGMEAQRTIIWGKEKYSPEVSQYTKRIEALFAIPQDDEEWIDGQWRVQFLKELGQGSFVAMSGLVFLLVFTWGIGWIIRGFMGIPRGKDRKESA